MQIDMTSLMDKISKKQIIAVMAMWCIAKLELSSVQNCCIALIAVAAVAVQGFLDWKRPDPTLIEPTE